MVFVYNMEISEAFLLIRIYQIEIIPLTHFSPMSHFYTPWKHLEQVPQKT